MVDFKKIEACYWGLALGDALGKPVEFSQIGFIKERYGEKGIQEPKDWSIWTDDTEMTIAVTQALLRLGRVEDIQQLDRDVIGQTFAEEFIKWLDNPGHAPGNTCTSAVYALQRRGAKDWRYLMPAKNNSKGCGSVMRAAPIGIWFSDALSGELVNNDGENHQLMERISEIQSETTHGHKAATAAALAGAYAVVLAINGYTPDKMINPIEKYCCPIDKDFMEALERMKVALEKRKNGEFSNDIDALHYIGKGWVGDEAFAMAFYTLIREPNDLKNCLRMAVNHSGDSDSVGCIAGSIFGAYHGIEAIPQEWIDCLAEKPRLEEILHKIKIFRNA